MVILVGHKSKSLRAAALNAVNNPQRKFLFELCSICPQDPNNSKLHSMRKTRQLNDIYHPAAPPHQICLCPWCSPVCRSVHCSHVFSPRPSNRSKKKNADEN